MILNTAERRKIEAVIELCREARERLQPNAPFRLRVLLDMTLLELGKELARLNGDRAV
ncbi:hypothetical protein [Methylobacterium haplocladii]|uniref:hypothetical protein n=1 Tax=Methylobacterium haplocladii TaxID=1176176 RepID=UPI0014795038|nr:hypothetical protein [Methylobacterium haplocladii]